ncbi:MAG: class I SAM-dependent methyltransferase [bacterium]
MAEAKMSSKAREILFEKYRAGELCTVDDKRKMFNHEHFKNIKAGKTEEDLFEYHREVAQALLKKRYHSKIRLLDIGCGLGHFLKVCEDLDIGELYGVDISSYALSEAREKSQAHLEEMDIESSPLPYASDFFDVVFFKNVIEHIRDEKPIMNEILRVLKVKGELMIRTINGERSTQWLNNHYGDPSYGYFEVCQLRTYTDLLRLLSPRFTIQLAQTTDGLIGDMVNSSWINETLKRFLIHLDSEIGLGIDLLIIASKTG